MERRARVRLATDPPAEQKGSRPPVVLGTFCGLTTTDGEVTSTVRPVDAHEEDDCGAGGCSGGGCGVLPAGDSSACILLVLELTPCRAVLQSVGVRSCAITSAGLNLVLALELLRGASLTRRTSCADFSRNMASQSAFRSAACVTAMA